MPVIISGFFLFKVAEFFQVPTWPIFLVRCFVMTTYQKWLVMVVLFHSLGVSFPFYTPVTDVAQFIWHPPFFLIGATSN